jgi:hypothetical protein
MLLAAGCSTTSTEDRPKATERTPSPTQTTPTASPAPSSTALPTRDGRDGVFSDANFGDDIFYQGDGNDSAMSGVGADRVYGGPGDDFIEPAGGPDHVEGGEGNDAIHGSCRCDFGSSPGRARRYRDGRIDWIESLERILRC